MTEMTVKEIQQVSLSIMKDVHMFCVCHNIRYTLFGGTMIGAIRHKGFIPWDDDLDIAMPRPDYERFIKEYQSKNGYRLIASGSPDSYIAFSRVCDMEKTKVINEVLPWSNVPTGVWIDVFPLDAVADDKKQAELEVNNLKQMWLKCCYARAAKAPFSSAKGLSKRIKLLIKNILYNNRWNGIHHQVGRYIIACQAHEWDSTNHYMNLSYLGYGMKEYQDKSDFDTIELKDYEDGEFYVMGGYDQHMRNKFGNYMQMPPVEKRKSNHELCSYYWKDAQHQM